MTDEPMTLRRLLTDKGDPNADQTSGHYWHEVPDPGCSLCAAGLVEEEPPSPDQQEDET